MVYKPRSSKKKTYSKRKSTKKMTLAKPLKNMFKFKRMCFPVKIYHEPGEAGNIWRINDGGSILNPLTASGTAWGSSFANTYYNGFGCTHRLNQIVSPTDLTNLFDRYKLTGVKVRFLYQISDASPVGGGILPVITYAVDNDDNAAPINAQALRSKQNCKTKILTANRPISVYYKPKQLMTVSDGAGESLSAVKTPSYINSEFSGVNHLGFKFWLESLYGGAAATTSIAAQLQIDFTYYFSMKDPQ